MQPDTVVSVINPSSKLPTIMRILSVISRFLQ